MVQVSLTVGKLDASLALLLTKDHHLIEFPTLLLPTDVEAGSIVTISCDRDLDLEDGDKRVFEQSQQAILDAFGSKYPSKPSLRIRNATQTSVVLEWDPIDVATADIISLTLYKNEARFGVIPGPLKRTSTKLSGLAIDTPYTFHLVLETTAGTYESDKVEVRTHKMTDLSGITVCVGSLLGSELSRADIDEVVEKIGGKPSQDSVKLDTTHFICTQPEGPQCKRAQDLNIPVVRPEWLKACEAERRLVGVRAYYLNADPKLRPPVQRSRATSQATTIGSSPTSAPSVDHIAPVPEAPEATEAKSADEAPAEDSALESETPVEAETAPSEPESATSIPIPTVHVSPPEDEVAETSEPAVPVVEVTAPGDAPDDSETTTNELEEESKEEPEEEPKEELAAPKEEPEEVPEETPEDVPEEEPEEEAEEESKVEPAEEPEANEDSKEAEEPVEDSSAAPDAPVSAEIKDDDAEDLEEVEL